MADQPSPSSSTLIPGAPYCGNCGYSLKGLDGSSRCPECGKPIIEVLMRKEFAWRPGKRYRSQATLFGLPVIDIALGPFGQERRGKAKGIIAIGDMATGWIAIGGLARGIVAIGGLAIGIFSVGGLGIGLLAAMGGAAISLGIANGGFSIGAASFGGLAIGIISQGGLAVGVFARGGLARGHPFPQSFNQFSWLLGNFPPNALDVYRLFLLTLVPILLCGGLIGVIASSRLRAHPGKDRSRAN